MPCSGLLIPVGKVPGLGAPLWDNCITPSRAPDPDGVPRGRPTKIGPNDDAATRLGKQRENEAAHTLTKAGYDIEQNPDVLGSKNPDYRLEGEIFDAYSPTTSNARNIMSVLRDKIADEQADRFVLNLDGSDVSLDALRRQLTDYPVPDLKQIIIVKHGRVIPFFPF